MKICPKCGSVASDNNQAFCLMDGVALIDQTASEPTVVMDRSEPTVTLVPTAKKRRSGTWILLALVTLVLLLGLVGMLMFAAYKMGSESTRVNINPAPPPSRSIPVTSATPTPVAVVPPTAQTPAPDLPDDTRADEPTPI
ncbi:MAG: hypothetical protein ABIV48_07555, partial [Pyrinomonadaceae bacterium]